ncbi:MAG TPA: hypothetical protein VFM18_21785 [Methanosarcina sp.]|nr:hypothetical protein [Methanosarcina sp.]
MSVTATWVDPSQNVRTTIVYATRRGFLSAYTRSKKFVLDHAVDDKNCFIIRPNNIKQYRKMK